MSTQQYLSSFKGGENQEEQKEDNSDYRLIHGDCLELYQDIEQDSADLIIVDPPYGTVQNADFNNCWDENSTDWDTALEPKTVFTIADYLLRENGRIVIFSQEPYSSSLVNASTHRISFCYRCIWLKNHFGNPSLSDKAPLNYTEDILVFKKNHDSSMSHPLRSYFSELLDFISDSKTEMYDKMGHQGADHCFRVDSEQFSIPTEETYQELIDLYAIDECDSFRPYHELVEVDEKYSAVFNLPDGENHKSNVFEYQKPQNGDHPTQKPVPLLRDLIRTYSNDGDRVVDFTMGSGSTGVASAEESRRFVGIELNEEYYSVAERRLGRR